MDFDKDDAAEIFNTVLEDEGIAAYTGDDGLVVGFTSDKLKSLLKESDENNGKIVLIIKYRDDEENNYVKQMKLLN